MNEEMITKVKEILAQYLENESVKQMKEEDSLLDYGLNSVNFIKAIVQLEETFDMEFDDDDLDIDKLGTLKSLCEYIVAAQEAE